MSSFIGMFLAVLLAILVAPHVQKHADAISGTIGRFDFVQRMHSDLDFLPRTADRADFDARLVAIDGQFVHLVQRLQHDALQQILALKSAAVNTKFQFQQPGLAREGMQEPAVTLLGRRDFDDRAGIPVGRAELTELMNPFLNSLDDDTRSDGAIRHSAPTDCP